MLLDTLAVIAVCYYERLEAKEVSKLLKTFKNLNNNINYYIYYDVIKTNKNKTKKSIILPDNELMYILAITLI